MFQREQTVMALGHNGLVVTIPTIWHKAHELKKGDKIIVEISDDSITIRTKKEERGSKN